MISPMSELHSFEELALAVGRFEMQSTPNQGNWGTKSLIALQDAEAMGLFEAEAIFASQPETTSSTRRALLDALGVRKGHDWQLRPPASAEDLARWKKVLASDQALIFVARSKEGWLENLVSRLHTTFVATVPSMSLTEAWLSFERKALRGYGDVLHVSTGATRLSFTFVGTGELFAKAVSLASLRPQMMWGYTPAAFKETLRSRKLIFPVKRAVRAGS